MSWTEQVCAAMGGTFDRDSSSCNLDSHTVPWRNYCEKEGLLMAADDHTCYAPAESRGGEKRCAHAYSKLQGDTCVITPEIMCTNKGGNYLESRLEGHVVRSCNFPQLESTPHGYERECEAAGGQMYDGVCQKPMPSAGTPLSDVRYCWQQRGEQNKGDCETTRREHVINKCEFLGYKEVVRIDPSGERQVIWPTPQQASLGLPSAADDTATYMCAAPKSIVFT